MIEEKIHETTCFCCYYGQVFIGRLEVEEDGEEVEFVEAVECRLCSGGQAAVC